MAKVQRRKSSGRVLVVGGSEEYVGAPYLAGMAALRSGAESVIVMAPAKVAWALNALSPDLMTRKLPGRFLTLAHAGAVRKLLKTADVLLLGNGAGTRPGTARLMRALARWPGPKVIDADALKALRREPVTNAVLTPNEGEWKLLEKNADIGALLKKNVVVKKGRITKISASKKSEMVRAEPGLSKAGMGDVLAGMIAGRLAGGYPPFEAALKAARRGNELARAVKKNPASDYLASDILRAPGRRRRAAKLIP